MNRAVGPAAAALPQTPPSASERWGRAAAPTVARAAGAAGAVAGGAGGAGRAGHGGVAAVNAASGYAQQGKHERDDGQHEQDVDQAAGDMKREKSESPADQKDDTDRQQHR